MRVVKTYAEYRKEALDVLAELGAIIYAKDIESFHGRVGDGSKWEVDPNFNNAGNNTGNHNVNKVNGLYTSDKETAQKFAHARSQERVILKKYIQGNENLPDPKAEVYTIVPESDDLAIIVRNFNVRTLSKKDQQRYYAALGTLSSFPLTKMIPIPFEYRGIYLEIKNVVKQYYPNTVAGLFNDDDITNIINILAQNQDVRNVFKTKSKLVEFVTDILSASNSRRLMQFGPGSQIGQFLSGVGRSDVKAGDKDLNVSINSKYMSAWCNANGIIGSKGLVDSATLGERIDVVTYFDTKKIRTEAQHGERLEYMNRLFEGLALNLSEFIQDEEVDTFLQKASAGEVMRFINQDPNCAELFAKSSGVWEGYTVGQHTEAVLDFLDKYKQGEISPNLLPFIKVAILVHDIGKGDAVNPNSKWRGKHKEANKFMAKDVYRALGIKEKYQKLIDFIFTESQDYTSNYYFGNVYGTSLGEVSKQKQQIAKNMQKACKDILKQSLGINPTDMEVAGLQKICIILQQCDSGAYTRLATIKGDGVYYTGGNDRFTQSFAIGKNGMPRLKTFEENNSFKR